MGINLSTKIFYSKFFYNEINSNENFPDYSMPDAGMGMGFPSSIMMGDEPFAKNYPTHYYNLEIESNPRNLVCTKNLICK